MKSVLRCWIVVFHFETSDGRDIIIEILGKGAADLDRSIAETSWTKDANANSNRRLGITCTSCCVSQRPNGDAVDDPFNSLGSPVERIVWTLDSTSKRDVL